ncbi:hypothetical protein [Cardinium endosymbiont of Culicoides punctatus]|uniref:hypothetical protein n=1 Tax=Cardinium endosymbiont of Culicoides punctatus TaxID=2304601 RepID=UPI0010587DB3|nr:hypothetical protein [Cardinium endosymbiont of Culicoides punctatus]TDG95802.1 hypothetical protein CCPUN_00880 [Cardinium endosymbiont of Culicoides punctatus]
MRKSCGIEKGKIEGEKIGIEKGKLEGKLEERHATVLKMLQLSMDIDTIADITTLSKEEIMSIVKDNNLTHQP